MERKVIVLDYQDNLSLPDADGSGNELGSLQYLAEGLEYLYAQVHSVENHLAEKLGRDRDHFVFGNAPQLKDVRQGLVACAFHWYAVSVCNYVRLVGWLAFQKKDEARKYVERVIPTVYRWRNKVGAHFAVTDPRGKDNPADLAASVMFPIAVWNNKFCAGLLKHSMDHGNGPFSADNESIKWCLTETHLLLCKRYWPNATKLSQGNLST